MTRPELHPVEILDQNRQPLGEGMLEVSGALGLLDVDPPLKAGHYYLRFTGDGICSVRTQPRDDGKSVVESRDYPYDLSGAPALIKARAIPPDAR